MQPLLTNKTTMDKQTCQEMLQVTWSKNAGVLRIILLVLAVFSLLYGVLQIALLGWGGIGFALGMLVIGGSAVFVALWGYRLKAGGAYKKQKVLWGGETLEKQIDFYQDKIVQHSRLGELTFRYNEISGMLEGKTILVLMVGRAALLMQKEGFDGKTYAESLAFIKTKINKK